MTLFERGLIEESPENNRASSNYYDSHRLRLHYLEWGISSAPPLLLIHGGKDNAHSWGSAAQILSRWYHVIVPDLRGHGDSDWVRGGDYQLDDFTLDIAVLIDILDLNPLTIVAHSFGGVVGLRYATAFPEHIHRLVVIEGIGKPFAERDPMHQLREWIDQVRFASARTARSYASLQATAERLKLSNDALSIDQARQMATDSVKHNDDESLSFKFDPYLHVLSFPERYATEARETQWAKIDCPVLLIHGEDSWLECDDSWPSYFPDARIITVPDAGHWVQHENFEAFMQALETFLKYPQPPA